MHTSNYAIKGNQEKKTLKYNTHFFKLQYVKIS